jgi:hypothetical protein
MDVICTSETSLQIRTTRRCIPEEDNIQCKNNFEVLKAMWDRLCGLVVRVLGYRSGGPGSIPGTTRKKICRGSGTGSTQLREYN